MRRFNCVLFVSLIVVAISVLTAWSVQSTELRMVSAPTQAALRSSGPESASVAVIAKTHPLANAGADQTTPVGATVLLDGSQSSDLAGDGLTFKWSFVSVPAGSTAKLGNPAAVAPTFLID